MSKQLKSLSVFSLVMITVGSVDSIRNLPTAALFGSQLVFFFLFGALFFLLPTALVSAELASAIPREGGIYVWVKQAFGKRWGFLAIWLQWIENVIWYPILLSFLAGNFGYLIAPSYADNPVFLYVTVVTAFSLASLINFFGMKSSARFSNFCAITGLLIPMAAIIIFGGMWLLNGNPSQINWQWNAMIPDIHRPDLWVSLTGVMMSLCGIEIATVHAKDVAHPQRTYPKVLFYSVLIICSTMILGSLAIAVVIPQNDINLVAGIMQTFSMILEHYHLESLMPIAALMIVFGGMGSVSNWIIAPTMGLMVAANDGCLPRFLHKTNRHGAPIYLLFLQVILVCALATMFMFMPSVSSSYWLLTALAAQLYMLMYGLMFAAIVRLRRQKLIDHAVFKIPGGSFGFLLVVLAGFIGIGMTLGVSFLPPEMLNVGGITRYHLIQMLGLLLMSTPPLFLKIKQDV